MPTRPALIRSLMQVPRLGRHVKRSHDAWLRRQCEQYWASEASPARRRFRENAPALTPVQQRVVQEWAQRGMAHVSFDELFPDRTLWDSLDGAIREWIEGEDVREKSRMYREREARTDVRKEYLVKLYGYDEDRVIPWDVPALKLGVQPQVLDIVNSYMGMMAILRYFDAWYTIPAADDRPLTGSQCWHRDPEDVRIAKVFLYFSDVDPEAGALEYVPFSRAGEKYGSLWPHKVPSGARAPTEEVAARIPPSDIATCAFPRGTFVFVDTTGLHRGGRATGKPRVFACWEFVSPAAPFPRSFKPGRPADPNRYSPAAHAALTGGR